MTTDVHAPAEPRAAVRWGAGPHAFELASSNPAVIERAATVFRPWRVPGVIARTHRWRLDDRRGDVWKLVNDRALSIDIPAEPTAPVRRLEYLACQAIFDGPPDVPTAHAALVARSGRGVLISGIHQTGKSTLACALWQRGCSLLGDDVAMLDLESLTAASAPRRVSIRRTSRPLIGDALWRRIESAPSTEPTDEGLVFHPVDVEPACIEPVAVVAIVFLARRGATSSTGLQRIAPAHAALACLSSLNLAHRVDVATLVARLTPFVTNVPAYDLRRGELNAMAAAVDDLLDP